MATENKWETRTPMFLSAFVCPGAGQIMQKRWVAAALFALGFIIPFALLLTYFVHWFFGNMEAAIGWEMDPSDPGLERLNVGKLLGYFGVAMAFYFAGLADTWRAQMRILRKKHGLPPPLP